MLNFNTNQPIILKKWNQYLVTIITEITLEIGLRINQEEGVAF
jgi:hypothetical protein